jgi:hypothetical protein
LGNDTCSVPVVTVSARQFGLTLVNASGSTTTRRVALTESMTSTLTLTSAP